MIVTITTGISRVCGSLLRGGENNPSVHSRHHHVECNRSGLGAARAFDPLLSTGGEFDPVASLTERALDKFSRTRFIIDHADKWNAGWCFDFRRASSRLIALIGNLAR